MKTTFRIILALIATPALAAGPVLWGGSSTARNLQTILRSTRLSAADGTTASPSIFSSTTTNSGIYFKPQSGTADAVAVVSGGADGFYVDGNTGAGDRYVRSSFGRHYFEDGANNAPSISFWNQGSLGLYRSASNEMSVTVNNTQTAKFGTTGFSSLGALIATGATTLGTTSTNTGATTVLTIQGPTTVSANSAGMQILAGSTVNDYSLIVATASSSANNLVVFGNGKLTSRNNTLDDASGNITMAGTLLKMVARGAGSTPTCGAGEAGTLALTSGYKLCVCNGSAWKNASDGSTGCTF